MTSSAAHGPHALPTVVRRSLARSAPRGPPPDTSWSSAPASASSPLRRSSSARQHTRGGAGCGGRLRGSSRSTVRPSARLRAPGLIRVASSLPDRGVWHHHTPVQQRGVPPVRARPSRYVHDVAQCTRVSYFSLISGLGYVLNVVSWIFAIAVVFGVVTTGLSADAGHRWAAGNRAYQPIAG